MQRAAEVDAPVDGGAVTLCGVLLVLHTVRVVRARSLPESMVRLHPGAHVERTEGGTRDERVRLRGGDSSESSCEISFQHES
jgi:hypothetical protein